MIRPVDYRSRLLTRAVCGNFSAYNLSVLLPTGYTCVFVSYAQSTMVLHFTYKANNNNICIYAIFVTSILYCSISAEN